MDTSFFFWYMNENMMEDALKALQIFDHFLGESNAPGNNRTSELQYKRL